MRLLVVISMVYLLLSAFTPFTPAPTGHGCAPLIPPTVPGPLTQPPALKNILFINEVLMNPDPRSTSWDCSGSRAYPSSMWVEIYNSQNQAFDLSGVLAGLDSGPHTNIFFFPQGSMIAAHNYLVVFPRTYPAFPLTETSTLRLMISGVIVDETKLPPMGEDMSYARIPDGSPNWQVSAPPTIDASNSVLPTPTATSGQRSNNIHATATATSRQRSNGNGATTNRGSNNTADTTSTSSSQDPQGVQPTWSAMQFPTSAATDETATGSPTSTNPPTANTASPDIPRIIVTILLVIALVLALLWCWRFLLSK